MSKAKSTSKKKSTAPHIEDASARAAEAAGVDDVARAALAGESSKRKRFRLDDRVEVLFGEYGHAVGAVTGFNGSQVLVRVAPRAAPVAFDADNLKLSQAAGTY